MRTAPAQRLALHRTALVVLLLAAGVTLPTCVCSRAGGACTPGWEDCHFSYYCALTEVCTRTCTTTADCPISCPKRPDGGHRCIPFEACTDNVCESTAAMVCVDGYCQRPCALEDGGCNYDPYAPTPRNAVYDQ